MLGTTASIDVVARGVTDTQTSKSWNMKEARGQVARPELQTAAQAEILILPPNLVPCQCCKLIQLLHAVR